MEDPAEKEAVQTSPPHSIPCSSALLAAIGRALRPNPQSSLKWCQNPPMLKLDFQNPKSGSPESEWVCWVWVCVCLSHSVVSNSLWPHRLQPARLLWPWISPGKNTGVGCPFLQGSPVTTISLQSPWKHSNSNEINYIYFCNIFWNAVLCILY